MEQIYHIKTFKHHIFHVAFKPECNENLQLYVYDNFPFHTYRESYEKINLEESYASLFELLWYSQLPCFDVMNVTTKEKEEHGENNCS